MKHESNRRHTFRVLSVAVAVSASALLGTSCPFFQPHETYEAQVYRTEGGIPHIKAHDYASLAYGTAYAQAQDSFCVLMDNFVTIAAQRSFYHGPAASNLSSDFFNQLMLDRNLADNEVGDEFEALYRGWAAGFNRYLREQGGADGISDPACQGTEWVREISAREVKHLNQIDFFLPNFSGLLVGANPPATAAAAAPEETAAVSSEALAAMEVIANPADKGSNGVALGRDVTESGNGMLFTNPHFPWQGPSRRFYPFHQILSGEFNLLGANVLDRANLVGFGTNGKIATTNTVSTAERFQFYILFLLPGSPTTYIFDGVPTPMTSETVTVQVRNPDDSISEVGHTFYSTHFGMLIGAPFFPWGTSTAFAMRVAGEGGRGIAGGSFAQIRAQDVHELKAAHAQYAFNPSNLIAVDVNGEALYADFGPAANFPDIKTDAYFCDFGGVIDGSRSLCQWDTDPDSAAPGLYGPSNLPSLIRTDYVTNSNDSFWLTNPDEPLTGFNRNLGDTDDERTLRTRSGLRMVDERLGGTDGLPGNKFTLGNLQELMFSNQNESGMLLADDLAVLCDANPSVTLPDGTVVDISEACPILGSTWDLHSDRDSRGAHLFREFLREAHGGSVGSRWLPDSLNYAVPYSSADPIGTPAGLDTADNPEALQALARAVQRLQADGHALDARLGDLQTVTRNGEVIEIHGGPEAAGVFNKVDARYSGPAGYPEVTGSSSSWVMTTELTADGPVARGILTYSIATDPTSPHFSDMTKLYSDKQWVDLPYHMHDVKKAALSNEYLAEGSKSCNGGGWKEYSEPSFSNARECKDYFEALRQARLKEIWDRWRT